MSEIASAQIGSRLGADNLFLGKTGAAGPASLDSSNINPAQAGLLDDSQVQLGWGYSSQDYSQRYPGFESHNHKTSGLDGPMPIPKFIYKAGPKFGISGIIIPMTIKQKIDVKDLPIVILGQENSVDLEGDGELSGYANLNFGYAFHRGLALGLNVNYLSFGGDGELIPSSGSGDSIASFSVKSTKTSLGMGVKYEVYPDIYLGIVTPIFVQQTTDTTFESALSLSEDAETEDQGAVTSTDFLNPIKIGVGAKFARIIEFMFDAEYKRAKKGEERYSVVDLAVKETDVYDTLSVYLGTEVKTTSRSEVMVGYFYEPSAIGPGKQGENEKTGFGFIDLAQNLGEPPESPQWMVATGSRYHFLYSQSSKKAEKGGKYKMFLEYGAAYGETSIGIDEGGEQPGAYLVRRYKFPLKLNYIF